MLWLWKANETFQFFVQKQPGSQPETTDTGIMSLTGKSSSGFIALPSKTPMAARPVFRRSAAV